MFVDDNNWRIKKENDIMKDVTAILGDQSVKIEKIAELLISEGLYEDLSYL